MPQRGAETDGHRCERVRRPSFQPASDADALLPVTVTTVFSKSRQAEKHQAMWIWKERKLKHAQSYETQGARGLRQKGKQVGVLGNLFASTTSRLTRRGWPSHMRGNQLIFAKHLRITLALLEKWVLSWMRALRDSEERPPSLWWRGSITPRQTLPQHHRRMKG